MKKLLLVLCIIIAFATCKKGGIVPTPPPIITGNNTGCLITSHTYTGNGPFEGRTVYHYDKNNQMTNIEFFNATYGAYPASKDTIIYSLPGDVHSIDTEMGFKTEFNIPFTFSTEYSGGSSLAYSTVTSLQGGNYRPGQNPNSPVTEYKYTITYDNKKRIVNLYESIHDIKMDIEYDTKNNVTAIRIEALSGSTNGTTTITASAYDDKPNPYANIPYWRLARHSDWIHAYDEEELLTSLSQNNPMDFTLTSNYVGTPIYTFKRVMTYTYNDKGLPIARANVQTQTGQAGSSTYNETYEYNCK